jgi:hypothetical protein
MNLYSSSVEQQSCNWTYQLTNLNAARTAQDNCGETISASFFSHAGNKGNLAIFSSDNHGFGTSELE